MIKHGLLMASMALLLGLAGCQNMLPKAKGLPSLVQTQSVEQYQVELFWKEQSFSFLLKQTPDQQKINVIALTFTGQVLFELDYDGQKVTVLQRSPMLKHLPLDFLMRDIWWATMPKAQVEQAITPLKLTLIEQDMQRHIMQNQTIKLSVHRTVQGIEIQNVSIPYSMLFTHIHQSFLEE